MTIAGPPADEAIAAAAELVLARLGVPLVQLAAKAQETRIPTFAEYVPEVAKATAKGSRDTWQHYWRVLVDEWGDRPIDEPRATEVSQLAKLVQERAAAKPYSRSGQGAESNFIDAVKCVYRRADADKLIDLRDSPTANLNYSRQRDSNRRALKASELSEINFVASTTGFDPLLDSLLLRLHSETACRRGGALALRRRDLNPMGCTVLLREKGNKLGCSPANWRASAGPMCPSRSARRHQPVTST
ncbi:hypothetical protein ACIRSS_41815 [Amycolatopsis sp. NPDC101161]|uniref:hypothetical protein n=1 Tax=Amycolatopsis sp. NPDC101161 TaxID=3363940 RepID=UPI00381609B0